METNDLKPLEWSVPGPINRAQITSFSEFDPANGTRVQTRFWTAAGHGWEGAELSWGWGVLQAPGTVPI